MAWRLILSAPKDGTAILVHRNIWPGTTSGFSEECNGHNTYVAEWWATGAGDDPSIGRWICYMDQTEDPELPIVPTHWMHLPIPPKHK